MCNEEEKTHLHIAALFLEGGERWINRERQAGRVNNKDVQHASAAGVKLMNLPAMLPNISMSKSMTFRVCTENLGRFFSRRKSVRNGGALFFFFL